MKPHKEQVVSILWYIAIILQVALAIFFFNSLQLSVFVYLGVFCLAVFFAISLLAQNAFNKKGGVPQGKNCMYTTVLVNGGIYSVVRHPMYTGWILLMLSFPLFSQHWLSLILGVITAWLIYRQATNEDNRLMRKFGDSYGEYMRTVPRVNLIGGLYSWLRKRKHNT
ncbi:MAG: isoprenylcysteine carboxylmethyltransferase family protein [Candidatus Bathyarchaeota archaeon]|nr:isoprenylcysteine carboxylmethyltransferase family protein [Candidatus Bathyarchaeota archaeon]